MIEMSFEEFKTLSKKECFIFFFTLEDYGCGGCKIQEKEYLKHDIPNLVKVKAQSEEDLTFMCIKALPYTCIFNKEGDIKVEKYGVQYEKQIKELLSV